MALTPLPPLPILGGGEYPAEAGARNRWILARRGPKSAGLDPWTPYAFLWEEETGADGEPVPTATIFLTNRECPFRCLMCDLWQNTLDARVPPGAIPAQIEHALSRLPATRQIKLYNAGSFFDGQAIPPEDDAAITERVAGFERVVVECHPSLAASARCLRFRDLLREKSGGRTRLEIAMGLETAHPEVLARLNKRMTVATFLEAAAFLRAENIDLRVFLLLRPPWLSEAEGLEWAKRSLDVALIEAGATVACVIPTRAGNGALDALQATGTFTPPSLPSLEAATEYGLSLGRGRVFADLWDIERFYGCPECSPARAARLAVMNRTQRPPPAVVCGCA